jgi:hypothetical protein
MSLNSIQQISKIVKLYPYHSVAIPAQIQTRTKAQI